MDKLHGWIRVGAVVSAAWIALTTFTYVNEIANHPSLVARHMPFLHNQFLWTDDREATEKAHAEARARRQDFPERYVFQKPSFSLAGFLRVVVLPLAIAWLSAAVVVRAVRWISEGFRT